MSIYLWLNAALYALFAVWCTVSPGRTATNLGYESLTAGGRSEYLVIYGGLQLGFAAFFAILARGDASLQRLGVLFALCLYVPIVAYRATTVVKFWPLPSMTLMVAALEGVLLVAALVLYLRS